MTTLRLARVTTVNAARRTADLIYLDNGQRVGEANIVGSVAGDSGIWAVPSVPRPNSEQEAGRAPAPGQKAIIAVVAEMYGHPLILGFISPAGGEVAFREDDRAVYRHPSGSMVTIGPDGTIDIRHKSGAAIRVGSGSSQPISSGAQGWNPPGGGTADLTIDTGAVQFAIKNGGTIEATCTTFKVTGKVEVTGDIETTGGDVKAPGSITLKTHKHQGVTAGGGTSGTPVP